MKKKIVNTILIALMIISLLGIVFIVNYAINSNTNNQIDSDVIKEQIEGDIATGNMDNEDLPDLGNPELSNSNNTNSPSEDINVSFSEAKLSTVQIFIIGGCSTVFALCFMYLVMSCFNKQKAFINTNKIIIYVLSTVIITVSLTESTTIITNEYLFSSDNSTIINVEYSSTDDLHIDMSNWSYDATHNVYYQIGLVYVSDPETVKYESLGIYVPGDYMDGEKNGDKYTCTINTTNQVGQYTSATAPFVMPVNTAGYSAQEAPASYSYNDLSEYLDAGFIYVYAGCRGRNNGDDYSGCAPWEVADLKSAVRYLRYNDDSLPGNTDSIFAFGHSGGGAQSSILGASGDSELYTPYLESIGAIMYDDDGNKISDAIAGVMAWCLLLL